MKFQNTNRVILSLEVTRERTADSKQLKRKPHEYESEDINQLKRHKSTVNMTNSGHEKAYSEISLLQIVCPGAYS